MTREPSDLDSRYRAAWRAQREAYFAWQNEPAGQFGARDAYRRACANLDAVEREMNSCPCGSGKPRQAQYDARRFFLCYTCDDCEKRKLAEYRPDVLHDANYEHEEPLDEE